MLFGFLLGFLVLGSLATAPFHLFRWTSALRLCAATVCGFLVLAQLNPQDSIARFASVVAFVFVLAGFAGSSLFRGGLTGLLQFFNNETFDPGGNLELPRWGHFTADLWISACITLLIFVSLSWSTQSMRLPLTLHLGLAVVGFGLLGAWWLWPSRRFTGVGFLRQFCLGCGITLFLLTSYSWFCYPSIVRTVIRETVGEAAFCIWNPDRREVMTSWDEFAFLTAPKRVSDSHFLLVSGGRIWEWSYHKLGFILDGREQHMKWFNDACPGEFELSMGRSLSMPTNSLKAAKR